MAYIYNLYGLILAVPFHCPMLTSAPTNTVPDVTIVEGVVPLNLESAVISDRNWQASRGRFLLRGGRRAGRFLIEDGLRITLHRNPAAEDELLSALLVTQVIAVLLSQRGLLVLHANVIDTPLGALAISGESGVGKSTTQGALLARGYRMLTDDVTALQMGTDGTVLALPGIPKMNLCEDAAIELGHDVDNLQRNPLLGIKVIVPIPPHDCVNEPIPLKKIYLIKKYPGDNLKICHLTGVDKFIALQDCIYGPQLTEQQPKLFSLVNTFMQQIDIIILQRPARGCSVNSVVEAILHG